jgi:hypothetical protein
MSEKIAIAATKEDGEDNHDMEPRLWISVGRRESAAG